MIHCVLLGIATILAGASSLTAVKAPTVKTWLLAILAGEFGHFFALASLGVMAVTVVRGPGEERWVYLATLAACGVAVMLYLKPAVQAKRLSRGLAERLEKAFGRAEVAGAPFSVKTFFSKRGERVKCESRVFAHAGMAEALTLDFYRARDATSAPCVIVVHGGGWDGGDRGQMTELNHFLALRGIAVAAVSYRLAPQHVWPAQRDDVRAAIAYLKAHAGELGIDAKRLILLGRSAGGQIAEAVAYSWPDAGLRGVVALYAPADLLFAWSDTPERDVLDSKKLMRQLTGGTPASARENFVDASPFLQVTEGALPTLLMHGTLDSLVWRRQSERLAEKLTHAGARCLLVELPWATHAFDYDLRTPGGQMSRYAIEWFVRSATREFRGPNSECRMPKVE